MQLYALLENNAKTSLPDMEITGLTDDSRKVQPGMLFACIRGERFDGHTAAKDVLERGAAAVLADHDLGLGDRQILTEDTRALYGKLCAAWFGHPERKMRFIGVTGTNGKTTITNLIKHILTENGHKVGLIGTIQNEIGDEIIHTDNTTPFVYDLMALYARMAEAGCDDVVMEVSSFGLVQQRIGETHFAAAAFTNLTQDHLDYHGTMENYYQAKKLLFQRCDTAIIDTDDEYGKRLYGEVTCPRISYGQQQPGGFLCRRHQAPGRRHELLAVLRRKVLSGEPASDRNVQRVQRPGGGGILPCRGAVHAGDPHGAGDLHRCPGTL